MKQMQREGSKEGQDDLALALLGPDGYFVDLGMGHPLNGNNTVLLERAGWRGQCFEINLAHCESANKFRISPAHCVDLTHTHIEPYLKINNAPDRIDFISFDVDRATIPAIEKFPFEQREFALMCFEHDSYGVHKTAQDAMTSRLRPWPKYARLATDVCFEDENGHRHPFEDWWINTDLVDMTRLTFHVGATWFEILKSIAEIP